jgi:hypothetical protein
VLVVLVPNFDDVLERDVMLVSGSLVVFVGDVRDVGALEPVLSELGKPVPPFDGEAEAWVGRLAVAGVDKAEESGVDDPEVVGKVVVSA